MSTPPTESARDRVSVILIVRNGARFIAEALRSVAAQTLKPDEVLVVDGHSTDDTVAIARSFPGVTVLPQDGIGIANAYNQGIARSRAGLVAFISHDDRWMPEKLERQVAALLREPAAMASFTHVQHGLESGMSPPPGFRVELLEKPVPGFIMETLLARRTVFDLVGRFDPSFPVAEDTDWFARLRDAKIPIVVLPETLVLKRVHGTNASLGDGGINDHLLRALRQSIARKRNAETAP